MISTKQVYNNAFTVQLSDSLKINTQDYYGVVLAWIHYVNTDFITIMAVL